MVASHSPPLNAPTSPSPSLTPAPGHMHPQAATAQDFGGPAPAVPYDPNDVIVRYVPSSRLAPDIPDGVKALSGLAVERVKSNETVEQAVARLEQRSGG